VPLRDPPAWRKPIWLPRTCRRFRAI